MSCIEQIEILLSESHINDEDQDKICDLIKTDLKVLAKINITKLSNHRLEYLLKEVIKKPFTIYNAEQLSLCFDNTFNNFDPMLILNEIKNNCFETWNRTWDNNQIVYNYVINNIINGTYRYDEIKLLFQSSSFKDNLMYTLLVFKSIFNKDINRIYSYHNITVSYVKDNYKEFISNIKNGIKIKSEHNELILHPESTKILNYLLRYILSNCVKIDSNKLALLNEFSRNYRYFNNVLYSMNLSMPEIISLSKNVILNKDAINYLKQIVLQNLSFNPRYCGCTNVVDKIINFEGITGRNFIFAGSDNSNVKYNLIKNKKVVCKTYHYQPVFNNKGIIDVDIHLRMSIDNHCSTLNFLDSFIFKNKEHKLYLLKHYGYNVVNNNVIVEGNITNKPFHININMNTPLLKYTYTIDITGDTNKFEKYSINIDNITFVNYKTIDTFEANKQYEKINLFNWDYHKIFTKYGDINYANNVLELFDSKDILPIKLIPIITPNFVYLSSISYSKSDIVSVSTTFLNSISSKCDTINKIILSECLFNYLIYNLDFILSHEKFMLTNINKHIEFLNTDVIINMNTSIFNKIGLQFLYKKMIESPEEEIVSNTKITTIELEKIHKVYEKYKFDDVTELVYNYIITEFDNIKSHISIWYNAYTSKIVEDMEIKLGNIIKYTYFYKQLMCLIYIDVKNIEPKIHQLKTTYHKSSLNYLIEEYDKMIDSDKLKKCKTLHDNLSLINSIIKDLRYEINNKDIELEMINWFDTLDNIINHQNVLTLNPLDELVLEFDAN
jgi:hypothetical protein